MKHQKSSNYIQFICPNPRNLRLEVFDNCRESSTNHLLFMQNKPNVKDAQINVNSYMKSKYEKVDNWLSGKNKANSNPIKPNFRKGIN